MISRKGRSKRAKSSVFAKASSTKLQKEVPHTHAALDEDETVNWDDYNFHELPFHL